MELLQALLIMEYSPYDANKRLYLIGLVCLVASISLLLFTAYLLPYYVWGRRYDIPEFVITWVHHFEYYYKMTERASTMLVLMVFFIPGILSGLVAYLCSRSIDDEIFNPNRQVLKEQSKKEVAAEVKATLSLSMRILVLIALVLIGTTVLEWLIYTSPPS